MISPAAAPGQKGRPRRVGARQSSRQDRLEDPATRWTALTQAWPDGTKKPLAYVLGTALGYHPGQPTVPLRWVLLRDPTGRREAQALLSTDPDLAPRTIPTWYRRRWQMEVTFQEVRAHPGVQTRRPWSAPAIARTTPVLLGLFRWLILGCPSPATGTPPATASGRLVRQDQPHLRRCAGVRSRYPLDRGHPFFDVASHHRHPQTATASARTPPGCSVPYRLKSPRQTASPRGLCTKSN